MPNSVPLTHSLADVYTDDVLAAQRPRWAALKARFADTYAHAPHFVARSPGRVNIIGEHIDYSLYPVLPMAVAADTLLAVSAAPVADSGDKTFTVRIANVDAARFPAREFSFPAAGPVDIDAAVHEWTNYFKAGLAGALATLRKAHGDAFVPRSLNVVMDGSVPSGGGLSSSAAFVSASALAVLHANGETAIDKVALTELAIVSERLVGVNSGGMDQSASILSERNAALFVEFAPALRATPVRFPQTDPELSFVIAQSFVAADKHVTGPVQYNLRVVECSLAAAVLHARLNPRGSQLPADASPLNISLHGFQTVYDHHHPPVPADPHAALDRMLALVRDTLSQEHGYTRAEIAAHLDMSVAELEARFMQQFPVRAERFQLGLRAAHVFGEAQRVQRFMRVLNDPTAAGTGTPDTNAQLGQLLRDSQTSCRELYACSCPELDQLCAIAQRAGAYGSRLTGAGWGGCSVHLVPRDRVDAVTAAWHAEYYSTRPEALSARQLEEAVVVSQPGTGSVLVQLE